MSDANNVGMGDSMPSGRVVGARAEAALDGSGPHPFPDPDAHPEPPADRPMERAAWQLRMQARSCAVMGSPLYGELLARAADDCVAGGPTWRIVAPHVAPGRGDALALRVMAAVHRLVLEGGAPDLAPHYPSVGGTAPVDGAWDAFASTLSTNVPRLSRYVRRPCQTNEVGRSAALMVGFLEVAARTGLPLRLLEVGASAGLNLRCDHFRIGGDGVAVGDPTSPVDLSSHWQVAPPAVAENITVVARRGCDRAPVDATTSEGRLALTASVWADQRERLERLRGALELARRHPAPVDAASLDAWTAQQVAEPPSERAATVVYHSVVIEYVPDDVRRRFVTALHAAGERASADRPLAWVRLEPVSELRHHGVQLTLWPGGDTTTLARCGAHGTDVEWLGGS
jgi:hypothetical protein